jgi:hypothetical protein
VDADDITSSSTLLPRCPLPELRARGFVFQSTDETALSTAFTTSRITAYVGFDPTADALHLGNLVTLMALAHLQRCGHNAVVLVGGATGLIGDPSGRDTERPLMDETVIARNVAGLRRDLATVLRVAAADDDVASAAGGDGGGNGNGGGGGGGGGDAAATAAIVNNYDWYSKMNAITFLRDVGRQFRMGPMLSKDSVASRLQRSDGMSFTGGYCAHCSHEHLCFSFLFLSRVLSSHECDCERDAFPSCLRSKLTSYQCLRCQFSITKQRRVCLPDATSARLLPSGQKQRCASANWRQRPMGK